jgi:putative transposase
VAENRRRKTGTRKTGTDHVFPVFPGEQGIPGPGETRKRGLSLFICCLSVFFEDDDRQFFLDHLAAVAAERSVAVHAYVLMTNHLHLLMTAARDDGVSAVMKRVGQRSVQHVNRTSRRTGGLFEGRFRSSLIEADTCLLACQRYIELNPVRASMVSVPGDYRWSSHRANALGRQDSMVTPHPLYQGLARL